MTGPFGEVVLMSATGDVAIHQAPLHEQYAGAWLLGKHSTNTRDAYRRDIHAYFAWCAAVGLPPFQARRVHVDLYRQHLQSTTVEPATGKARGPYSPASVARKLTAVSSYYTYVVQESPHMDANPAVNAERPEVADESTTVGLDLVEAKAMIAAADAMGRCESAAVRLLLTTGLRVSEVAGADTRNFSVERGHRIITVTRKRGRRQKIVVSPATAAALDAYLGRRTGHVFLREGAPMTRHQLADLVAAVARRAGIGKHITPHSLRHSATTLALDEGATLRDVQTLMGHIDPRTTNRYDRARHNLDRSAVHVLAAALDGGLE